MKSIERKLGILQERLVRLRRLEGQLSCFADYEESLNKKDVAEKDYDCHPERSEGSVSSGDM